MGNKNTKVIEIQTKCLQSKNGFEVPEEDLNLLKSIGFQIEEFVSSGEVGSVYRGVYGHTASGIRDSNGHLLNVNYGQQFALKYIDIKQREEFEFKNKRIERMQTIRRFVENEKQMRRKSWKSLNSHFVQINICLNLSEYQTICLNSETSKPIALSDIEVRQSFDRIYLLMDFSKLGNLDKYLLNFHSNDLRVDETEANIWCKRLLSALNYLHESNIFDVNIKPQNVLMFEEYIQTFDKTYVVPKLSDFYFNDFFGEQTEDNQNISSDENSSQDEVIFRTHIKQTIQ